MLQECADRQESRMQDYAASGAFKTKTDRGDLHMFFSPRMIPAGLTDEEVGICIALYPRRRKLVDLMVAKRRQELEKKMREAISDDWFAMEAISEAFGSVENGVLFGSAFYAFREYDAFPLPQELLVQYMTREAFSNGILKLVARLNELEKALAG